MGHGGVSPTRVTVLLDVCTRTPHWSEPHSPVSTVHPALRLQLPRRMGRSEGKDGTSHPRAPAHTVEEVSRAGVPGQVDLGLSHLCGWLWSRDSVGPSVGVTTQEGWVVPKSASHPVPGPAALGPWLLLAAQALTSPPASPPGDPGTCALVPRCPRAERPFRGHRGGEWRSTCYSCGHRGAAPHSDATRGPRKGRGPKAAAKHAESDLRSSPTFTKVETCFGFSGFSERGADAGEGARGDCGCPILGP